MATALLIDNDLEFGSWVAAQLKQLFPLHLVQARTIEKARQLLPRRFDVVLLELLMPDGFTTDLAPDFQAYGPERGLIVMSKIDIAVLSASPVTSLRSVASAMAALRPRAYIVKPVEQLLLAQAVASVLRMTLPNGSNPDPPWRRFVGD